jgi:hypothetical protein
MPAVAGIIAAGVAGAMGIGVRTPRVESSLVPAQASSSKAEASDWSQA